MATEMYAWFPFRRPASSSIGHPDDVRNNLEWLEEALKRDKFRLDAVETRPYLEAQTEMWKKEIKGWAYDAEDLIDEWKFEQLGAAVEPTPPPSSSSRRYARDPHAEYLMDPSFRRRVDELRLRREEIDEFNRMLRLGNLQPWEHDPNGKSTATSSLPLERVIHGREDDKEILVKFLLGEEEEGLSVVPILGAAGVGKTSLLQDIFNDPQVSKKFSSAWVSSSKGRQGMELNKAIGESLIIRDPGNDDQLGKVQDPSKRKIDGQKLLLVLDDVWYESIDGDLWAELLDKLSACADGSVIILTTQDEKVAETTGTVPPFLLESLTGDPCRSVFLKNAFSGSLPTDGRLVEVGEKIAKECQGSPLVAKALGLRLRHERDVEYWKEFLEADMWDEVVPELKLSYHRLPAYLKRCFVYCSMFPRGYLFNREELVQMWIAQGFIEETSERSLEDNGLVYFDELSTMSFFQRSELDAGAFVMPNLLHALAESISDGECITTEKNNLCNIPRYDLQKARHLSLKPSDGGLSTAFHPFTTHLRSFLVVPKWPVKDIAHISLSDEALHSLNRLRVLNVRHTDIAALPETVGNLKHLRYLNLSGTKVEHVHASVCKLYNLQTLDLSCTDVRELPDAIGNLSNLRHLRLNVTKITKFPESIGKLSKLQTLHLSWTKIEEFPETIDGDSEEQLRGQNDQIIPNQGVSDMADSSLYIDRGSSSNDATMEQIVYENLQPHTNLQMSDERFYHGERLLMWMGSPLFFELTYVVIKDCAQCKNLPQLGQLQRLKELHIDGTLVKHVGKDFCGSGGQSGFPSLEKLSFQNMSEWEEWDGVKEGDFPKLVELIFFSCPKLKSLPCRSSSLIKLKVERCALESIPAIGSLRDLELLACDNLVTLPPLTSLQNLTLMYCQNLKFPSPISLPKNFWIEDCEQLKTCLPDNLKISSSTFYQMTSMSEPSDP
ncbi:hypothetical protein Taro_033033 [Colocasia esculenta]|uniref:NB-ARC domain-containing protein n=1 Tax=Colocasia esculenta TaxID=4460 RepID=A0A843VYZ0_COLES|nr:hypothetical protein [Colocasia esculenta]